MLPWSNLRSSPLRFGGFTFDRQFGFGPYAQAEVAAASPGFAAWPSLIGAEMMVNGDCGSATGWTVGAGCTVNVTPGKMVMAAYGGNASNSGVQDIAFVDQSTYRCAFTIDTATLGSLHIELGNTVGTTRSTAATFSQDLLADDPLGGGGWKLSVDTAATMQLDNFSVKSVGLLGVEADWTLTGGVIWDAFGGPSFGGDGSETAALTGSAKISFDAAVSNSTACTVTVTGGDSDAGVAALLGSIDISMKGGTPVTFVFNETPGQQVSHTVTSGAGSGFLMDNNDGDPIIGVAVRVQITLA